MLLTATIECKNPEFLCHFTEGENRSNNITVKQAVFTLTRKPLGCDPY